MKYLVYILAFLLPFHALIVTILQCRFLVDTNILRFWKEFIVIILLFGAIFQALKNYKANPIKELGQSLGIVKKEKKHEYNFPKIFKGNYILGLTISFALCSLFYCFFPFFITDPQILMIRFLGFKYDVFFLLCVVIGLYLILPQNFSKQILKTTFFSTILGLVMFLPWFLFGDISKVSTIFGFSSEVSTYKPGECIAFSQNVEGQHRFQGTFGGPIQYTVFLVVINALFFGYIWDSKIAKSLKILFSGSFAFVTLLAIFLAYTKTSLLGFMFSLGFLGYLLLTVKSGKSISKNLVLLLGNILGWLIIFLVLWKKEFFMHLGSIINRFDNLIGSVERFLHFPYGYGLGFAGPASWLGENLESAGGWEVMQMQSQVVTKFLPENWYVQIVLEQGLLGLGLFLGLLFAIGYWLWRIMMERKDYLSIGIFTAFISLCFMVNFTHGFEESATSFILFLLIGLYLKENGALKKMNEGK